MAPTTAVGAVRPQVGARWLLVFVTPPCRVQTPSILSGNNVVNLARLGLAWDNAP
ncbi:MAG: hypothetical protein JWN52_4286 [Actinomycetia bacterium]|nr:hypothetical protein [Actinomycetes bacterium]